MLLLALSALAHVPHDNVGALAVPAGLDASYPWLIAYNGEGYPSILRSDDAGFSWEAVPADLLANTVNFAGAGMLADGTTVFLTDAAVWWTPDGGDSWDSTALPGDVTEIWVSDKVYLAGDGGVFSWTPGDTTWGNPITVPIKRLGPGPSAVSLSNRVFVKSGGRWTLTTAPDSGITASAASGSRIYAGTSAGELWVRVGRTWSACGALPFYDPTYPEVTHIAVTAASVLVATAEYGPYVSNDYCATWTAAGGGIEQPDYENTGGVNTFPEAYTALYAKGRHYVLAGWDGLWQSEDAGATWDDASITTPAYTRGITFAADFPTDPRIWYGPKSTGIVITEDGGATVSAPSHGLVTGNISNVWASPDPTQPDTIYASGRAELFVSYDGGVSWDSFAEDLGRVQALSMIDTPTHLWVLDAQGDQPVKESWDGGASWDDLPEAAAALDGAIAYEAVHYTDSTGADRSCLLAQSTTKVVCTDDGGASWSVGYDSGVDTHPVGLLAWPEGAATRLLFGDEDGVYASDDQGLSWTHLYSWGEDGVVSTGQAADGTLFAATQTGVVYRSSDGGDTWEDTGARAASNINSINPRPDWDAHQDVLFGTQDGNYQLTDALSASPGWQRWCDVQRVDDASTQFHCDGCIEADIDYTADMNAIQPMPAGSDAEIWLRGTSLEILGNGTGADTVYVFVDGDFIGTISEDTDGLLGRFDDLSDDQHRVNIYGDGTGEVKIDAVQGWRASDPLDLTP